MKKQRKIKKRRIAVVTGARSEYGILKPLLEKIKNSKKLELQLIVTGMHLLPQYGFTINEIKKDGFRINRKIKMYIGNQENPSYYGKALGKSVKGFTEALLQIKPDILVVFGDRLEPLAATIAAVTLRIPIVHIHGGDKTDSGHIDESYRGAITRFSNIHFPPTKKCKERLIEWGEEPWRIYNVGALGLDSFVSRGFIEKEELFQKLGLNPDKKLLLCVFHSLPAEAASAGKQMREILKALKKLKIQTAIIYPNNDAGSQAIIKEIEKNKGLPFLKIFPTLPHSEYVSLLRYANALIGNSSCGIIEAPIVKLPVINIMPRNIGREHAENVIFLNAEEKEIIKGIKKILYDKKFLAKVKKCKNPYGNGGAGIKIVKILEKFKIDKNLLKKKIIDR